MNKGDVTNQIWTIAHVIYCFVSLHKEPIYVAE